MTDKENIVPREVRMALAMGQYIGLALASGRNRMQIVALLATTLGKMGDATEEDFEKQTNEMSNMLIDCTSLLRPNPDPFQAIHALSTALAAMLLSADSVVKEFNGEAVAENIVIDKYLIMKAGITPPDGVVN